MKLGLIGCGTLGTFLLERLNQNDELQGVKVISVLDEREKSKVKLKEIEKDFAVDAYDDVQAFLQSDIDVVVECANIEAVKQYAAQVIRSKDLIVISIGAFADTQFYQELQQIASEHEHKLILPSGGIGGLDLLKAAKLSGGLEEVMITTRKPAASLINEDIQTEKIVFDGIAKEAIEKFPKNINVGIMLSLAGLGPEETKVRLVADPTIDKNQHTIAISGDFGKTSVTIENFPMPSNPKTSYLTGLSLLAAVKSLRDAVKIG